MGNMEVGLSPFSPPGVAPAVLGMAMIARTALERRPTVHDLMVGRAAPTDLRRGRSKEAWAAARRRTGKVALGLLILWVIEAVLAALNVGISREY